MISLLKQIKTNKIVVVQPTNYVYKPYLNYLKSQLAGLCQYPDFPIISLRPIKGLDELDIHHNLIPMDKLLLFRVNLYHTHVIEASKTSVFQWHKVDNTLIEIKNRCIYFIS